jgi:hypothetical protein
LEIIFFCINSYTSLPFCLLSLLENDMFFVQMYFILSYNLE